MWSPITCLGMECVRKKGGRGHLAAKKAEDNEVQWHHGMAGQELRNVPESGLVIIKMFHPRAAK